MRHSRIVSTGSYLPSRVVLNDYFESYLDTTAEWIDKRTGIRKRHIASDDQYTSDLASYALSDALAGYDVGGGVDAIIVATCTPDTGVPAVASIVQAKSALPNCMSFDVNAVCSGFVYALVAADSLIRSCAADSVAVIGADIFSRVVDWNDRSSAILFGDGAGAAILTAVDEDAGIVNHYLSSDGYMSNILEVPVDAPFLHMEGRKVFKHAVEKMLSASERVLALSGWDASEVDHIVPHQANARIIESIAKNFPGVNVVKTVSEHANTAAASIPLALDVLYKSEDCKNGDKLLLSSFGAGLSWGAVSVIR